MAWVIEQGASQEAAEQIVEYIAEGKRVLGIVPTSDRLVAERFADDAGGMQLVIHSPLGARINRAWGLALRKRFCVGFNFELQAAATDDGINIALSPQHSFPLQEVFTYIKTPTAKEALLQAVLQGPLFPIRWRWTVSRSLALLRQVGGKRVPTAIQRMRSDDLLAAVFPDAAACQDNLPAGANIVPPEHPLVFETIRDCLTDALDLDGMTEVIGRIESGEIELYSKDTVQPSVFSHQLLNAMPYAFLDDAPLEERRARAVTLRRSLPEDERELSVLDSAVIAREESYAWPPIRDADELHDALLSLNVLTDCDFAKHADNLSEWQSWYDALSLEKRVETLTVNSRTFWVAAERAERVKAAYLKSTWEVPTDEWNSEIAQLSAVTEILRGRIESSGPFNIAEMVDLLAIDRSLVTQALLALEQEGLILRGKFRQNTVDDEYCDKRILARITRATIGKLRKAVEPVPVASLIRFLLEWQHVTPGSRLTGNRGAVEVIEQLQGFEAAAAGWESSLLNYRLTDFKASTLDTLCFGGKLAWGRFACRSGSNQPGTGLSRNGPVSIGLRADIEWLLDAPNDEMVLSSAPAEVRDFLAFYGASFMPDIIAGTKRMPSEIEDAIWVLVAAGMVTADGFGALRGLVTGVTKKVHRQSRFKRHRHMGVTDSLLGSRWSLLAQPPIRPPLDRADSITKTAATTDLRSKWDRQLVQGGTVVEARAAQLLRRYGIVTRELLEREPMAPPWGLLARTYRRAEARGEVRGGRFVAGLLGEQFALQEAVDAMRVVNQKEPTGEVIHLSACDPLNLVGIITPGSRIPAVLGNEVRYQDGIPLPSTSARESL